MVVSHERRSARLPGDLADGASVRKRFNFADLPDHCTRFVSQFRRPDRIHCASLGTPDRSWDLSGPCCVSRLRHRRCGSGRTPFHRLAAGSLLRAACRLRFTGDCRSRYIPAIGLTVDPDGRDRRRSHRIWHGWRSRRYSLSAFEIVRPAGVLDLVWVTWTAYAVAGAIGPIVYGKGFRCDGLVSNAPFPLGAVSYWLALP